jgi:hypothetical protein
VPRRRADRGPCRRRGARRTAGARSGRDTDCAAQATRTLSGPPGRCSRVAAAIQWENEAARSPRRRRNGPISPGLSRYAKKASFTQDCGFTAVFGRAGCDLRNRRSRVRIAPGASTKQAGNCRFCASRRPSPRGLQSGIFGASPIGCRPSPHAPGRRGRQRGRRCRRGCAAGPAQRAGTWAYGRRLVARARKSGRRADDRPRWAHGRAVVVDESGR